MAELNVVNQPGFGPPSGTPHAMNPAEPATQSILFPPGISHAWGFAAFNALSFQMVIGSPMILFAKSLGANGTELGLIAGMLPLLTILQMLGARFVGKVGHKRFVVTGWSVRVVFGAFLIAVPFLEERIGARGQLIAVIAILFFFNASRGFFSCGWLPWITSILPREIRGRYLTRESAVVNLTSLGAFCLAAVVLGKSADGGNFAALFAVSTVAGIISVFFLSRIPEDQDPYNQFNASTPVSFREMLGLQSYRKLLTLNTFSSIALGGLATFSIVYLRETGEMSDSRILILNSAAFIGGLSNLWILGKWLDQIGSRPVLMATGLFFIAVAILWALTAMGHIPQSLGLVLGLMYALGLGSSAINLSNMRLAMAIIPETGRSHYFAVFSVVGSVVLGLSPILWGLLIDLLKADLLFPGAISSPFMVVFWGVAFFFGMTFLAATRLDEPEAASFDRMLRNVLTASRVRYWIRLWPR